MAQKKPMPLSASLRRAILNSGETGYSIAKALGVSAEPIYRFINGERDIRFKTAERIAEYLDLELVPRERD